MALNDPKLLDTPAAMGEALAWAWQNDYRGFVEVVTDRNGNIAWGMELNQNSNGGQCSATMGETLDIVDGMIVNKGVL